MAEWNKGQEQVQAPPMPVSPIEEAFNRTAGAQEVTHELIDQLENRLDDVLRAAQDANSKLTGPSEDPVCRLHSRALDLVGRQSRLNERLRALLERVVV